MPASSFSWGTMNASIPSSSSLRVTSSMSMPASARAFSSALGSRSTVASPVISPRSATAIRVAMGIVFTVSGPTISSMYLVSR